jgi:hypothetical protein
LLVATSLLSTAALPAAEHLICCGGSEVFVLPADAESPTERDRVWRWTAADSPEIPEALRERFRSTDDCKPFGPYILITSSSDGVALVRRKDKACVFHTLARNAHSGCLLPEERIVVAASFGGDELRVFDRRHSGADAKPLFRLELVGAHGAWWNSADKRLWALGSDELLEVELSGSGEGTKLVAKRRWKLPTAGGHDLSPTRDGKALCVTTNTRVYRFELESGEFAPYDGLSDAPHVKSVDEHPALERAVYHQAAEPNWWSDRIRFVGDNERTIQLPGERLYKVRWDVDRGLPQ